ncbi:hypothetical protein [Streptomyces sp. NPDC002187]|uniref:hypothetical protein n=1 Tax=Streptomyces sp. NPDC002187 TaxID=3364637 RepID=UPI00368648BC
MPAGTDATVRDSESGEADLADPLFRDHVVERWRYSNNQALVPPEWITEPIDDEDE